MQNESDKNEEYFLFSKERTKEKQIKDACQSKKEKILSELIRMSKGEYKRLFNMNLRKIGIQIVGMLFIILCMGVTTGYSIYSSYNLIQKTAYYSMLENVGYPNYEYKFLY